MSAPPRVLRNPPVQPGRRPLTPVQAAAAIVPAPAPALAPPPSPTALEAGHAAGVRQGLADAQSRIEKEIETRWQAHQAVLEQAERRRAEEHAQRLAALDTLLHTVERALPDRWMALERQAVALAYEALCRVCGPGGDRGGLMTDIVRHGIGQLRGHALLGVRLHPLGHAALHDSEAGRALVARHGCVEWQADPALEPLGCVLQSDHGQLDAGLATQLARLRELWLQAGSEG